MQKLDISKISAYELVSREELNDINSEGILLKHKKTGARVVLVSNDDDNKVFYIGFRTTPDDSTGVMHILEHSVLCGSKKFPIKDPFIELAKGSLNTFLNAMTFPDKTVYPVASTNDKDFQNLMHVYLDAVFYPNILNSDMTFKQEGWHYEMQTPEDDLTINGVVYNEMKGAFSSPDDVLERAIFNSLFPDTTYGQESGGDPKDIPNLTYENYLNTYKKYYHPSNSYIYLYGDMDMVQKLDFIDKEYLSAFSQINVDSEVTSQKAFDKTVEVSMSYSITESEPVEDNSYLSYNVAMESNLDSDEYIAMQIIDYALCSAPGAVLKQTMLDRNIGKDIYSYYDNGVKQPYFSIVAKNSEATKKEEFLATIEEVLKDIISNGFDKDTLRAAVNALEFKFREADFGSYPPGLMYGLQALDSWLYDDNKPFIHIEAGNTYKKLRNLIETDYFEKLLEKYLLNNNHKSIVIVVPEVGLVEKEDKELAEKLAQYKASLSKDEIEQIVADTAALKAYQEEEDSPEALSTIPVLELSDIKKECAPLFNEERSIAGKRAIYHNIDTRGIDYMRLVFDITNVPEDLVGYIGILKNNIGLVDTKNYSYGELFNKIHICTGGITSVSNIYTDLKNPDSSVVTFEWKAKVLEGGLKIAFELIDEMTKTSVFDNAKRNYELIAEMKSRLQGAMMSSGHQVATGRLATYFNKSAVLSDKISGYSNYRLVENIEHDFDSNSEKLAENLKKLCCYIFTKDNILFDFAGSESEYAEYAKLAEEFVAGLKSAKENLIENGFDADEVQKPFEPVACVKNEGIMSSSQVNYVCRGGNFIQKGLPYTGALKVLRVIMSYDYLWTNVRVKNGAYGCMNSFSRGGDGMFVSYRDPNLVKTVETYEGIADYLRAYDADEREMTQYIIGAVSELDSPLQPSTKALRSFSAYMANVTVEDIQKERDEVLGTTTDTIRNLDKYIDAVLEDNYICVVGNEEAIKSEKDRFDNLENMFQA